MAKEKKGGGGRGKGDREKEQLALIKPAGGEVLPEEAVAEATARALKVLSKKEETTGECAAFSE